MVTAAIKCVKETFIIDETDEKVLGILRRFLYFFLSVLHTWLTEMIRDRTRVWSERQAAQEIHENWAIFLRRHMVN